MPWTYQKRDGQWCVYKKGADGSPTGEALGCHDTKSEALEQIAALEANVSELDGSYNDFIRAARSAFEAQNPSTQRERYYVRDVFEDHVIIRESETDQLFRVPMKVEGDAFKFAPKREWEKVRLSYVQEYTIGEFRGDFPEIETDSRVDIKALTAGDDDPFYIVLPIARVGEVSANGLVYDEALVKTIREQMVSKGGIMGHIDKSKRETEFPIEDVDWVGVLKKQGTVWGKAYVSPGEVREYVRRLKARGGKLATSIYGPYAERKVLGDGKWKAVGFKLESVDLAPADRAALKLGGQFAVTAQMETETADDEQDLEDDMLTKEELLQELTAGDLPQALREQVIAEFEAQNETTQQIAELTTERDKAQKRVSELEGRLEELEKEAFEAEVEGVITELVDWKVKGDAAEKRVKMLKDQVKSRIISEMGDERDLKRVSEVAKSVWESEDMKLLAETVRDALSGGPAMVGGRQGTREIDDSPEARRAARARVGI